MYQSLHECAININSINHRIISSSLSLIVVHSKCTWLIVLLLLPFFVVAESPLPARHIKHATMNHLSIIVWWICDVEIESKASELAQKTAEKFHQELINVGREI
jgi:hypothetical protein